MSKTIRRPARSNRRHPHSAVRGQHAPGSVVVEILRANHIGRDIPDRLRVFLALIANAAPVIEAVVFGRLRDFMIQRIATTEYSLLILPNPYRSLLSGGFSLTLPNRHTGRVAVRIDIETVFARLHDRKCEVAGRADSTCPGPIPFARSDRQDWLR